MGFGPNFCSDSTWAGRRGAGAWLSHQPSAGTFFLAWCPRKKDVCDGMPGTCLFWNGLGATCGAVTQMCRAPALVSWKEEPASAVTCPALCCHISQQTLTLTPQQEKTSSFEKAKDHVDISVGVFNPRTQACHLGRCTPISFLSVIMSNISTPFWGIPYISFHMCALTCLWKSKYNFIKFFAWIRS